MGVELAERVVTDLANSTIVSGVNVYSLYKLFNENKPTTASQIKAGKDALREALDILHRALMDGLPIPQKEVHILTRKHETLLLFCDKFEKSAAERFSFNLHHIFVQPFTDNHKARSFNAQCHELLYLTQRSSDISRLRSIKGILQDSQFDESATLTTWSMVLNPESPSKGTDGGSSTTLVRCSNDVVPNKSGSTPSLLRVLEFNPWRESDDESGSSDMALRSEN